MESVPFVFREFRRRDDLVFGKSNGEIESVANPVSWKLLPRDLGVGLKKEVMNE